MAIDKEFLAPRFEGREDAEEQINAILAEYDKEKLTILKNRDDITAEKKLADKKNAELQQKIAELESVSKELNEKLESGLPDKEKQFFQGEIEKLKSSIVKSSEEYTKAKAEYEEKINGLSREKTEYIIGEEFSKLVNANTAIYPTLRDGLHKRFFADYPKSKFEPFDYSGKVEYVVTDGQKATKMADLLNDFLNTEEGKHYLQNTNTGGGAAGGSKGSGSGMNRKQFDTLPYAQQIAHIKGGGTVQD